MPLEPVAKDEAVPLPGLVASLISHCVPSVEWTATVTVTVDCVGVEKLNIPFDKRRICSIPLLGLMDCPDGKLDTTPSRVCPDSVGVRVAFPSPQHAAKAMVDASATCLQFIFICLTSR